VTRLLTTREVADRLALSPETVLRWTRAGRLPAIKLGSNAIRYREEAIEAFLERSAVTVQTTLGVPSTTEGVNTMSTDDEGGVT
jgi:excisionase family DNA binding protein